MLGDLEFPDRWMPEKTLKHKRLLELHHGNMVLQRLYGGTKDVLLSKELNTLFY